MSVTPVVEWLVVADDLTGAADTGHGFAARGHDTVLALGEPAAAIAETEHNSDAEAVDVLVVDTDSRDLAAEAAAERVRDSIAGVEAATVYKKIDSTLRGNLVAELDAAIAARKPAVAVVAPAFPATGRVTACDHHLVEGRPIDETAFADTAADAASRLSARLAGSERPVEHLGVAVVARGADAVATRIERAIDTATDPPPVLVCDAVHPRHLQAIADGTRQATVDALYVGSGGLAEAVAAPESGAETDERGRSRDDDGRATAAGTNGDDAASRAGALAVVGSTHPRSVAQVAAVPEEATIALDPAAAVRAPERTGDDAGERGAERLAATDRVLLTSVATADAERRALAAAEAIGLDDATARERVATALARAGATVCERRRLRGLLLTGGATAGAVLGAIDAATIQLSGQALGAGVPIGYIGGGVADGTTVVTKAGGFGDPQLVSAALAQLADEP